MTPNSSNNPLDTSEQDSADDHEGDAGPDETTKTKRTLSSEPESSTIDSMPKTQHTVAPLLRLPNEILSIVLLYALKPESGVPGRRFRFYILLVNRLIHSLALPLIYQRITWFHTSHSASLLPALDAHPEYLCYVREVELLVELQPSHAARRLVDLLRTHISSKCSRSDNCKHDSRIHRLRLSTSGGQFELALVAIHVVKPVTLEWEHVSDCGASSLFPTMQLDHPDLPASLTLYHIFNSVVSLHLGSSRPDMANVYLLAVLPNLQSLTLSGPSTRCLSPQYLVSILTAGFTHANLTDLTISGMSCKDRRELQSQLGLCILTVADDDDDFACRKCPRRLLQQGRQPRIWHGCQSYDTRIPDDQLTGAHVACPRCCVINGQVMVSDPAPLPSEHAEATEKDFGFGLCTEHYEQIFPQLSEREGGPVEVDEITFFRKRLLECVRWHHCNDDTD